MRSEVVISIVTFLTMILGVIVSMWNSKSNYIKAGVVLIFIVLGGVIISFTVQQSNETRDAQQKAEIVQSKVEQVQKEILTILKHETFIKSQELTSEEEKRRREKILVMLRQEYILSHDRISPRMMAGTELLPSDWVQKRLKELGEDWDK